MKNRYLSILLSLYMVGACHNQEKIAPSQSNLVVDKFITEYPDSSFFSNIDCMQYYEGNIYILDVERRDIMILDTIFNKISLIGQGGRGPKELTVPVSFHIKDDITYIFDGGTASIKKFQNCQFIDNITVPSGTPGRFCISDSSIFISDSNEKGVILDINKNNTKSFCYYGEIEHIGDINYSFMVNQRNLFYQDSFLVSIPEALPFIEQYDAVTKKIINKFDLSKIDLFEKNLNYIKQSNISSKSHHILINDSYAFDNDLFLLCSSFGEKYSCNKILRITLSPQFEVVSLYNLPSNNYETFCVSKSYIYAYNASDNTIEALKYRD